MKNMAVALILIAVILSPVTMAQGCNPSEGGKPAGDYVVLRVNGREVTFSEFEELFLTDKKVREFREELIDRFLVEEAAAKAGITVTGEEMEKRQEEHLSMELCACGHDVGRLKEELGKFGYASYRERMKVTAAKTRMLLLAEKMIKKERTAQENMRERFKRDYGRITGKVVRVYHMLISAEEAVKHFSHEIHHLECMLKLTFSGGKEKFEKQLAGLRQKLAKWEKLDSKKVAKEVVEKLRAGGDFAELAREYGAGYSAEFYDKGWLSRKQVHEDIVPVIFEQLRSGEVSDPMKCKYGYRVVKLLDIKDASKLNFNDVKPRLLKDMEKKGVEGQEFMRFFLNLRKKATIERFGLSRAAD